jgi:hypothetical protein
MSVGSQIVEGLERHGKGLKEEIGLHYRKFSEWIDCNLQFGGEVGIQGVQVACNMKESWTM